MSNPLTRRQFLRLTGLVTAACLVPDAVARAIHECCVLNNKPFLVLPRSPKGLLYAVEESGEFALHLGDPEADPEPPKWGDYLWDQGVDPADRAAVVKWFYEAHGWEEEDVWKINPDKPIDGGFYENWLEWDYSLRDSPMARAYHYLDRLKIGDGSSVAGGDVLGAFDFIEGDRPGSNLTYVRTCDLASLACLQHRLNELDERVEIKIVREQPFKPL